MLTNTSKDLLNIIGFLLDAQPRSKSANSTRTHIQLIQTPQVLPSHSSSSIKQHLYSCMDMTSLECFPEVQCPGYIPTSFVIIIVTVLFLQSGFLGDFWLSESSRGASLGLIFKLCYQYWGVTLYFPLTPTSLVPFVGNRVQYVVCERL